MFLWRPRRAGASASACVTRLRVCAGPERLRISCANPVGAVRANGAGLGLQGMSERVALLGGTLHSGTTPGDGFVVDVDIPLAGEGTT